MIAYLHLFRNRKVIEAKRAVEATLFLASFDIQRDFVFTKNREPR